MLVYSILYQADTIYSILALCLHRYTQLYTTPTSHYTLYLYYRRGDDHEEPNGLSGRGQRRRGDHTEASGQAIQGAVVWGAGAG